ncbi:MAG: response regulator [Gammaproteobacteria bacterium]|nr:response regulator [Gammaproteobacteria bacterium]
MYPARIVVADDDRLILATLVSGLEQAGYEVRQAQDGVEAVRQVLDWQPDIALLDVRMPGLNGVEAARQIRTEMELPLVFLSAYSDDEFVRIAMEEGAFAYLVKPLDIVQILPTVAAALKRGEEMKGLKNANNNLNRALQGDRNISIAVGLLMERKRLTESEAFETLRRHARSSRRRLPDVAQELVEAASRLNTLN